MKYLTISTGMRNQIIGVAIFLFLLSISVGLVGLEDCDGSGGTCPLDCEELTRISYSGCTHASTAKIGPGTSLLESTEIGCGIAGVYS